MWATIHSNGKGIRAGAVKGRIRTVEGSVEVNSIRGGDSHNFWRRKKAR